MSRCEVNTRGGIVYILIPRWRTDDVQLMTYFDSIFEVTPETMGDMILRALRTTRSEENVTWNAEALRAQNDELFKLAGVANFGEFSEGTTHVTVEEDGNTVTIIPMLNVGSGSAVAMESDRWLRDERPAASELGVLVLQGLDIARSATSSEL